MKTTIYKVYAQTSVIAFLTGNDPLQLLEDTIEQIQSSFHGWKNHFKSGYCFSFIVSHLNSYDFYDLSKCFNLDIKILKYMETTLVTHLTYPAQRFKGYFSPAEFHSTFLSWFSSSTVLFNFHFQLFFNSSSLKDICTNFWKHSSSEVLQWKFTSDQGEKRHPAYKIRFRTNTSCTQYLGYLITNL